MKKNQLFIRRKGVKMSDIYKKSILTLNHYRGNDLDSA